MEGEIPMKRPTWEQLMAGPKRQFNLRIKVTLLNELHELALRRGLKLSKVALLLLVDAVLNKCRRCHWGLVIGSTPFKSKPCRFCRGTGRLDMARLDRKLARGTGKR
jgi:hypothetical protein